MSNSPNPQKDLEPIEGDPFATFAEWSSKADDAAFAHLADPEKRLEALRAAIDAGDPSGVAEPSDFDTYLRTKRRRR